MTVLSRTATARIGVRAGRVTAMRVEPDDGDFLGDALRRMGAWDDEALDAPMPDSEEEPVGRWAARVGATTASAVSHALRKQLQRRMARLFALDPPELRLTPGKADIGVLELEEPPKTAELIVSALRERVADLPLHSLRRRLGDGMLVLTPLGRELLEGGTLWPEEQALVTPLEAGASLDTLIAVSGHAPRALRTLYALRQVGACAPPEPRKGYATLLRKTRQVRRAARAAELLDLPPGARDDEARRALRRLAAAVHPDRFGTTTPAAIRSASHQVMSALVKAQHDLA